MRQRRRWSRGGGNTGARHRNAGRSCKIGTENGNVSRSRAAGFRAERDLKSGTLVGGKRRTRRKTGVTETGARHGDAGDGDVDVTRVLDGDVLGRGGLQYLIAKADHGWRYLHSTKRSRLRGP